MYKYTFNGTSFVNTGITEIENINTIQVTYEINTLTDCIMVIPKFSSTEDIVNLSFYSVCPSSVFTVEIGCPSLLPSFSSTMVQTTEPTSSICDIAMDQTYYFAKVHTTVDTNVDITDWVFSDPYGANVLPDGWYKIDNLAGDYDVMQVQNGVVIDRFDLCSK